MYAYNLCGHWLRNSGALITQAIAHFDRRNFPKLNFTSLILIHTALYNLSLTVKACSHGEENKLFASVY